MRSFKMFGALVAVLALSAFGVANASAATFTASETGTLTGEATSTQVFTTDSGGKVECKKAATSGTIKAKETTEQHVTVNYSECTAFGVPAEVTTATYNFTANGEVHILNNVIIHVLGFFPCTITVPPQTVKTAGYSGSGTITTTANVTKISYSSTGGLCGSSGTAATYTGSNKTSRVGGGSISFDA